ALEAAEALLRRLGAVDAAGALTGLGRNMLGLPLHPRIARVLLEADSLGVAPRGGLLAALLSERDVLARGRTGGDERPGHVASSDLIDRLERFEAAEAEGLRPRELLARGLDPGAM